MRAKLTSVKTEMRRRMHHPIPEQGHWLASVLQGHYNYYAVPDNSEALRAFRRRVIWHWRQALRRRSQKGRITWKRMRRLAARWLPQPRILHPWPDRALRRQNPREEPSALTRTLGSVRGAAGNGGPYRCARHDQQLGGASPLWRR